MLPSLGAPEGAVVAAFERIDLIASDVVAEIVAGGVEPDRALADHAFAHRLIRRAGTLVMVGPGPLVVAPDLSAGMPSDAATRAGRGLALQLISVALALADGLSPAQVVIDPLPAWLADEAEPAARAIAEVAVRRALFPDHPFGFVQPSSAAAGELWRFVQAAAAVHAGDVALVLGRLDPADGKASRSVAVLRAGSSVGRELAAATAPGALSGSALAHAQAIVAGRRRHPGRACPPGLADGRRRPARLRSGDVARSRDGRRANRSVRPVRVGARPAALAARADTAGR